MHGVTMKKKIAYRVQFSVRPMGEPQISRLLLCFITHKVKALRHSLLQLNYQHETDSCSASELSVLYRSPRTPKLPVAGPHSQPVESSLYRPMQCDKC